MIKRSLYTVLIAIAVTCMLSCTRNNGNIGHWFGTWRLESITVDGERAPGYAPPYLFWKFQSSVIQMLEPDDTEHVAYSSIGSWEQNGDRLLLNFECELGTPHDYTLLQPVSDLRILKLTARDIRLEYITPIGQRVEYYLKKWG